jgi:hypothetical protein
MINKSFYEITKRDIESLIVNEVAEGKTLEYKEELPGSSDGDKKEFLYDISAFANASGGDILYGIAEKRDVNKKSTGIPGKLSGLSGINIDAEIRRLQSCIQDGIAPRIPGIQIRPVDEFAEPVIIIRIPKSWNSPHMVTLKGVSHFYSRNSTGKYQLDIDEIRAAFIASESLAQRIKEFRIDRISKLVADETPVSLEVGPKTILHVLPIESLNLGKNVDVTSVAENYDLLKPIQAYNTSRRYNFDGIVKHCSTSNELSSAYSQLFRNGVMEAVDVSMLLYGLERRVMPIEGIEKELIETLENYLKLLKTLGINPPILAALSFLGVRGFTMATPRMRFGLASHPIDRDNLLMPEVLINSFDESASTILRPSFDTLWQSAGWQRSLCYDDKGNWVGFR